MSIEELKQAIKESEARAVELRQQLVATNAATEEMRRELSRLEYGIEPGVIVVCRGRRYRVVGIAGHGYGGKPWLRANPERSDGTFGTADRRLYDDWEVEGR